MSSTYLAFDLGAESGRAVAATFGDSRLDIEVLHRFPTENLTILGRWQWNATRIYQELLRGMEICAEKCTKYPAGIAVDTWGVDYGLLASDGSLLGNPAHYRDNRTEGMREAVYDIIPEAEVYARTGIVSHPFNTLYQLYATKSQAPEVLDATHRMIFMGPLLTYFLSGAMSCDYTIASTAQMLSVDNGDWDRELLEKLGIPTDILLPITPPGTTIGTVTEAVAAKTGLDPRTRVISTAVHDTAAAVAAVPVYSGEGEWAYLSSGTWSLLGAELDKPVATPEAHDQRYTNEGGVGGKIRFLKNIFGLWIIQECRRAWVAEDGGESDELSYASLVASAAAAPAFQSVIDLDDERLLAPKSMPETIRTICKESGVPVPESRAEMIRCAMESLAMCYRRSLRAMDDVLGRKTARLHIIGGGVQNRVLCQMTADACGIPVYAGPVEATAIGNALVQAIAGGDLPDLEAARRLVANSFQVDVYTPADQGRWDEIEARMTRQ